MRFRVKSRRALGSVRGFMRWFLSVRFLRDLGVGFPVARLLKVRDAGSNEDFFGLWLTCRILIVDVEAVVCFSLLFFGLPLSC